MNRTVSPDQRAAYLRTRRDEDLPIVDAHHHFWDIERNNHPWLREIYSGFKTITTDLEPRERLKLFHDNAVALYRLHPIEARLTESSQRGRSAGY